MDGVPVGAEALVFPLPFSGPLGTFWLARDGSIRDIAQAPGGP